MLFITNKNEERESIGKKAWLITFCDLISLLLTFFILIYAQVFIKKSENIVQLNQVVNQNIQALSIDSYFSSVFNNLTDLNLLSKILNYKLALISASNYIEITFDNHQMRIFVDLEKLCEIDNDANKLFLESIAIFFTNDLNVAIHVQDNIIDFERAKKLRSMFKEYTENINILIERTLKTNTNLQGDSIGLINFESN